MSEVAGPAGAGKSTLVARLLDNAGFASPEPRSRPTAMSAAARALAGRFSDLGRSSMDRSVIRSLALLEHWGHLARTPRERPTHYLIDQGPVYRIIQIANRLGLPVADQLDDSWAWRRLQEWSGLLDSVVYLDAPDDVLLARVQQRPKHHRFEEVADGRAREELDRVRSQFQAALAFLEGSGVGVIRFDTASADAATLERDIVSGSGLER